jgi:hypothetical protein
MSGPGDVGGEVSGEEAAWRDLVARFDSPADLDSDVTPWPSRENLAERATSTAEPASSPDQSAGLRAGDYVVPDRSIADRTRVIRHAGDPRSYSPPDEDEDEKYVAVPLPRPAKLDAIAKAAWLGLVGGPAYLLIATFLNWTISGPAAFVAVAAFIGGFVTLVIKLGDRPRRNDDDDGAVL